MRNKGIYFILFVLSLLLLKVDLYCSDTNENIQKGSLFQNGYEYKYVQTDKDIIIKNEGNKIVFFNECENANEMILGFGYSKTFDSFYVFKSEFNYSPLNYKFYFETEDTRLMIKKRSLGAFYTPILIETEWGTFASYIDENRSIVIYNLLKNKKKFEFKSDNSIMSLELITINDIRTISFRELNGTQYKKVKIPVRDIFNKNFDFNSENYRPFLLTTLNTKKVISINDLQYDKFIGFGDSITYGTISKESAPELGYIPRIFSLLQSQLYSNTVVINEGVPGFKTSQGLERIEAVIRSHKGRYILFHYGTNDMTTRAIPLESVKENIKKMIEIAIEYKMKPILTTLIPGNGDYPGQVNYGASKFIIRSESISEGIREISISKNIPLIDLQRIFIDYPESDGGYLSLMSDHLHPSEKGYQLMAEEWLNALLDFPPINISEALFTPAIGLQASIQWANSPELDVNKYRIRYGFSPGDINKEIHTNLPSYTFIITPMSKTIFKKIYFRVNPVDTRDNASTYSPIFVINLDKSQSSSRFFINSTH